jgi:serine/threonine protein phosphatase PrpC
MEVKLYIQNLLRGNHIEIDTSKIALLEEFANNPTNSELVKTIFENQKKIINNWNMNNRIYDIQNQHIVIPNAKESIFYSAKIDFVALNLTDLVDEKFEGLEEFGLTFNKLTSTIEGKPTKSGDIKFKLLYKIKGEDDTKLFNEKLISLVINPDPKSLWILKPSNQDAIFAKPDNVEVFEKLGEKSIVVSSKRGRSHGKEFENSGYGLARDDDFGFKYFEKTQWSLVVVSDGAGTAFLARKGSQLACDAVIEYFELNNDNEQEIKLEILINEYNQNKSPEKLEEIKKLSKFNLWQASLFVHSKLKEFAEQTFITNPELFNNPKAKSNLEYLHSTLIFTLFKKFDFGYIIQSFGVGDCPIAIMNLDKTETTMLNWLDVGEYGGGTRFITQPDIFHKQDVMTTRFNFNIIDDFSYLFLMTDGIYDAKFEVEANLEKHEKWLEFLEDLDGNNDDKNKVEFNKDNKEIANQLSKWMDFWSPGNHDDRTLAIVF